jgi:hypothetical protein
VSSQFEPLEEGEVISVDGNAQLPLGHHTFRVAELTDAIKKQLEIATSAAGGSKDNLLSEDGVQCEALLFGSTAWKKGRLRLCLEFSPDEGGNSQSQTASDRATPVNNVLASTPTSGGSMSGENVNNLKLEVNANPTIPPNEPVATQPTRDLDTIAAVASTVTATATIPVVAGVATSTDIAAEDDRQPASDQAPAAPMAEAVLLTEEETKAITNDRELDEIAFDFDRGDANQGVLSNHGSMDLDLTDTVLDDDYLGFEHDGLPEAADLSDLFSQPENSGLLIDEVWNEMNQPNWPRIPS